MTRRVSVVTGATPFVRVTSNAPHAFPCEDGSGAPISLVSSGAPPIVLLYTDLTQYAAPGVNDLLMETGDHLLMETGDAILLES